MSLAAKPQHCTDSISCSSISATSTYLSSLDPCTQEDALQAHEQERWHEQEAPAIDVQTRNAGEFYMIYEILMRSYPIRTRSPIEKLGPLNQDSFTEWKRASLAPESRELIRELAANKRELAHVSRQIEKQVPFKVIGLVDSHFRRHPSALEKLNF
jgi:hypothetical protein